ncbi:MAG: translation initiation factor IF-3 [Hyphomicrobiales bacterium]|nr:translation initiation factor IF-3 [Hyphomicrobiales bacterium]
MLPVVQFVHPVCFVHDFAGETPIRRPFRALPVPQKDGPRTNRDIRIREVQLIDQNGENKGVVLTIDALKMAEDAGLDLVEIAPNSVPPVCKILDYGRFRFAEQKKAAEARKNQKVIEIKEIKLRPGIDKHDYEVKMRSLKGFIEEGDKVKITLRFRGREMAHQHLGMEVLNRVKAETAAFVKVESEPSLDGRQVVMVLAPK